jgi:hypothetical protein
MQRMGVEPGPESGVNGPVVGSYPTYAKAQEAVDFLSDNKFPVEHVAIIGSDLRMVENVTGRLTSGRVAAASASSGAWFGLLVGVLLSTFGTTRNGGGLALILAAVATGAIFGLVFGLVSYRATGGRRDFTSRSQVVASSYDVTCAPDHAEDAKNLLIKLGWRTS